MLGETHPFSSGGLFIYPLFSTRIIKPFHVVVNLSVLTDVKIYKILLIANEEF